MTAADLILRWMHILGAIVLVGGVIFMRYAYLPPLQSEDVTPALAASVRRRWCRFVMGATALLLISGLVNFVRIVQRYEFDGGLYHMVFGIKFLLALVVFFLAAAVAGRSQLAQRLQENEKKWLTLTVALAVTIVLLAGVMKLTPRTEKTSQLLRPSSTSKRVAATPSLGLRISFAPTRAKLS